MLGVKAFKLKINTPLIVVNQSVGAALNYIFDKDTWQLICKINVAYNKKLKKAMYFYEKDKIKESKAKKKQEEKDANMRMLKQIKDQAEEEYKRTQLA